MKWIMFSQSNIYWVWVNSLHLFSGKNREDVVKLIAVQFSHAFQLRNPTISKPQILNNLLSIHKDSNFNPNSPLPFVAYQKKVIILMTLYRHKFISVKLFRFTSTLPSAFASILRYRQPHDIDQHLLSRPINHHLLLQQYICNV